MAERYNGHFKLESVDYHAVGMSTYESADDPFVIAQHQLDAAAQIL